MRHEIKLDLYCVIELSLLCIIISAAFLSTKYRSCSREQEGERVAVILDQTIMYPQGGGQPFDTGSIESIDGAIKFRVTDVRAKSGVVTSKAFDS